MQKSKFAQGEITDLEFRNLGGSPEALNELLDFSVQQVPDNGLKRIFISGWGDTVDAVEAEILTLLAAKASDIKTLFITQLSKKFEMIR